MSGVWAKRELQLGGQRVSTSAWSFFIASRAGCLPRAIRPGISKRAGCVQQHLAPGTRTVSAGLKRRGRIRRARGHAKRSALDACRGGLSA